MVITLAGGDYAWNQLAATHVNDAWSQDKEAFQSEAPAVA